METWPDAAYSPFRSSKGSTWEGGQRIPGIVTWPGMIDADRASDGLFSLMDWFPTLLRLAGAEAAIPDDRFIDGVDQTSFLLAEDGSSNRKYLLLLARHDVLGVPRRRSGSSCSRRRPTTTTTCMNLGGFSGVTQKYTYGRLYNLYLDPKETHSYMIRKLAYLEAFQRGS